MSTEREANSAAEDRNIEEAVKRARIELKALLNEPVELTSQGAGLKVLSGPSPRRGGGKKPRGERRKKKDAFIVFAK